MVVLAAGCWLLVAWWALDYEDARRAVGADVLAGSVLVAVAAVHLLAGATRVLSVLTVWTGFGLFIAPGALQYGYLEPVVPAIVSQLVVGVAVMAAGVVSARQARLLESEQGS